MPVEKRTMRFLLLAMPMLLAGCGSDDAVNNSVNMATPELQKGPMLGSIDLSRPILASGDAPSWTAEIAPGRITFADSAGSDGKLTDFYPVSPRLDSGRAIFPTQTPSGEPVTITLTPASCGGEPLVAELRMGARVLKGCARAGSRDAVDVAPGNDSAPPPDGNAAG